MLLAKILSRKRLAAFAAAFFLGLLAANLTFALIFESGRSLEKVLTVGETDGIAILQRASRSIYTSRIPASVALSLDKLPSVHAEALVTSMCYVSGSVLVARGTQSALTYASKLVSGSLLQSEGPWIILGERTAERLHARVGAILPVASSLQRTVQLLTVTAICRFSDLRDDEALVQERVARQLSDLPEGMVSAIVVRGLTRERIESLLGRTYRLRVRCLSAVPGNLVVLEASGAAIRTLKVLKEVEESLELPFGYYVIMFESPYLYSTLGTILLDSDQVFQGSVKIEETPVLKVPGTRRPVLRRSDGVEVEPLRQGELWVFKASPGLYRLELGAETFVIPLFYTATFDPGAMTSQTHPVRISVMWSDGSEATGCNLIVKKPGGDIVLSVMIPKGEARIDLPRGDYTVEAYEMPYLAHADLSVPTNEEIKLILPSVKNIEKIPLQYYTFIKAMSVQEISSFTLVSISGISAALLTGLSVSIIVLFTMMIISVQTFLYVSARHRLILLTLLGASRTFLLRTVGIPSLLLNIGLGTTAALTSSILVNRIFNGLTIFGHSVQGDTAVALLFSLGLTTSVWFLGYVKVMRIATEAM